MPEDTNNKWYGCPKCRTVWRLNPDDNYHVNVLNELPGDVPKVFPVVEGEQFDVIKFYPQLLCPTCGEVIIKGRKKGPINVIDLKREGIKHIKDLQCPVCGYNIGENIGENKEIEIYPDDSGTIECECSSLIHIECCDDKLISASYREDLEYVEQLKEELDLLSKVMAQKGTPIITKKD
jgi:hypothetical protein